MIRGKFLAQDDFDLAGHRMFNWKWLDDIPHDDIPDGRVIATVNGRVVWAALAAGGIVSTAWADILDKPTDFTPSDHTHDWSSLTGLPEAYDLPPGGTTKQRLAKVSDEDYEVGWVDDCPPYKVVGDTGVAEGDVSISSTTTWGTTKALIKQVVIATTSTDWELWILQNGNGYAANDAAIPAMQLADGLSGNSVLRLDHAYEDEDAASEVHLYWQDNSGTRTYDVDVIGYSLS